MPRQKRKKIVNKENQRSLDESILPTEGNEKLITKELFLKDFDIQVRDHTLAMENRMKKILNEISRMVSAEKVKINKEIRSMKLTEFLERGGDLSLLELKELSSPSIADVSYMSPQGDGTVPVVQMNNNDGNTTVVVKKPTAARKLIKGKRGAPESPLVRHAMRNTRSKKTDLWTPLHTTKPQSKQQQALVAPLITPKFDPNKPLTAAREPKQGETLVSLAGSPVVKAQPDQPGDDSHLVSISMLPQSTVLGGRLFLDEGMSPNTLMQRKQIIEEAVSAINSRLEILNSQLTATGSTLDVS